MAPLPGAAQQDQLRSDDHRARVLATRFSSENRPKGCAAMWERAFYAVEVGVTR